ncbi:hypothetical protein D3C83_309760 [compost metagenome]
MWHRIFRALRSAGPTDHVLDFRHLSEDIFDAVIETVYFFEGSLWRQNRLEQERTLVQLGHKVAADSHPQ